MPLPLPLPPLPLPVHESLEHEARYTGTYTSRHVTCSLDHLCVLLVWVRGADKPGVSQPPVNAMRNVLVAADVLVHVSSVAT